MKSADFIKEVKGMIQIVRAKGFPRVKGRAFFLSSGNSALEFVESHRIEEEINKMIFKEIKSSFDELILKGGQND